MLTVLQKEVGEQKSFSLFGHFSFILLFAAFTTLSAQQSFKDFKKAQSESFQSYKDERDKAFNEYLKEEWRVYTQQQPDSLYEEPKPEQITPAKPQTITPVGPKVYIEPKDKVKKQEDNASVYIEAPSKKVKNTTFDFFGTKLSFNVSEGLKKATYYPQNQLGISNFFSQAALSEYEDLLTDVNKTSKWMNLNDWGVYLLVTKISQMAFSDEDSSNLLSWFLLNKLGYSVKVGISNKHVLLLHYSKKVIYATPSYSFSNKKFYALNNYTKSALRIFSYEQDYPNATKELELSLRTLPNFEADTQKKLLSFSLSGKRYDLPISYNKNLIDFMATYPQADYETFFNTPLDRSTYNDLNSAFKGYIQGKKASEAINFVLHFVQSAFKYEIDGEQFGREKVMFAQETLYYDKSDCEDRAILFSYLVKELFKISVVGIKYKDHMATALYIPLEGDSVSVKSKRFVIADPTYINATLGMSMPKYRAIKPLSYITIKEN
jgi:hypothetical protein